MTNAIVKEKKISFKTLEKKIFEEACKIAREHTKAVLESYDEILLKERDASKYRNKGKRKTSIRTVYGMSSMKEGFTRQGLEMERRPMFIFLMNKWVWRR